ncbi:membrane progestin receptor alpha-like [Haliotis rubra]|uniref:membrane progestin receptor alpha-like n=1 Tax=Haliotis rubra TaxID=36100 RepID=UPI001EE4ED29|nr:membrane progestin receptor alpha-like [Haliotis rubra]
MQRKKEPAICQHRGKDSSTMTSVLDYMKILLRLPLHQSTLPVTKVAHMFKEPYILSGYRPTNKPWTYYILSFFQLHNESVNVWTHSLAFVLVLTQIYRLSVSIDFETNKDAATIIGFSIGALIQAFLSSACHLLHTKSPWWHYIWFLLDYAGVTFCSFGTGLACFYVCSHKYIYGLVENVFLPFNVLMSWMGFCSCCIAKLCFKDPYSKGRKMLMVFALGSQAFLLGIPVLARYVPCILDDECSLSSLTHLHFVFIFLICDALTFTTHFPEALKPGHFDIFGHGHQIFHISTLITMIVEMEAIKTDILSGATAHTRPDLTSFLTAFVVLIVVELLTLVSMRGLINTKVKEVLSASKSD